MKRIGASSSTARAPSCDGSWAGWNKSNSTWTSAGASSTQKSSGRREVVRAAKGQKWSKRWAYDDWTWQDGSWNDSTGEWQDNSGRWNAWDSTQVTAPPERPNGNANWEDVKVIYILMEGPINFSIFLFGVSFGLYWFVLVCFGPKGPHGRGPLGAQGTPWEGSTRDPNKKSI